MNTILITSHSDVPLPEGWYWESIDENNDKIVGVVKKIIRRKPTAEDTIVEDIMEGKVHSICVIRQSATTLVELHQIVLDRIKESKYHQYIINDILTQPDIPNLIDVGEEDNA